MRSSRTGLGSLGNVAATIALACLPGCGGNGQESLAGSGQDENVASVEAAITSSDFYDGTQTIAVRVKTCDYAPSQASGSLHVACTYCVMDSGWARVGGGAEIFGEDTPGAQLVASRPIGFNGPISAQGCTGGAVPANQESDVWIARSRGAVSHQLRAYVIGMKIKGTNGAWVAPEILPIRDSNDSLVGSPQIGSTTSVVEPDWITVGGGAEVVPNSENAYLIESAPVNTPDGLAWRASARVVSGTPVVGVKTWVVGLDTCPSAWNGDCFTFGVSIREAMTGATSGYGTASYTLPSSWVTPVVGGRAPSGGGGGRYLADLVPFNGSNRGARARSKPGPVADSGATYASALALGRYQAPYTFNSVRFNSGGGYTLYRPSGANPKLQQSSTPGDTAAARWHLEHLGNGVYRLRNGNPDSGSECAYRVTGTSAVRVTTCGTGDEFKWLAFAGPIYSGPFKLKSATNSTLCLDNNGLAGASPSDLVLKTCSAASDARQLLFLDAYNWPPP